MTYDDISNIVEKYHYEFPIIGDDGTGQQIVITQGPSSEQIAVNDKLVESKYYDVYTYLKTGRIKHERYYDVNVVVEINDDM